MIKPRWTYSNKYGLTRWYGNVDYFDQYVIGQWFVLDADTGTEYWNRRFYRPNTFCAYARNVIIASETRSSGPWTNNFGIYGIDARTGKMLWTNHGSGLWGILLRCLDFVPGYSNEFRDAPKHVVDQYVLTRNKRLIDVQTGCKITRSSVKPTLGNSESSPQDKLYHNHSLDLAGGDTLNVEGGHGDFVIHRCSKNKRKLWRFAARDLSVYVDGNYYSYRLHQDTIFIVIGDAPKYVPINDNDPYVVKNNPANYSMGILDIISGECRMFPLEYAEQRKECRIEAIRNSRMLVSYDSNLLIEYEIRMLNTLL